MAIIDLPNDLRPFLSVEWTYTTPQQTNRSGFTSRSQTVGLPGAELWAARATLEPMATEREARAWRAFLMSLRGAENRFRFPALPSRQWNGAPIAIDDNVDSRSIEIASTAGIVPGMYATIPLTSGHERLVVITNIGSGGVIEFEPSMPGVADEAKNIEINEPWALMRNTGPAVSWTDAGVVSYTLEMEEAL
jgi:hypothetical protein